MSNLADWRWNIHYSCIDGYETPTIDCSFWSSFCPCHHDCKSAQPLFIIIVIDLSSVWFGVWLSGEPSILFMLVVLVQRLSCSPGCLCLGCTSSSSREAVVIFLVQVLVSSQHLCSPRHECFSVFRCYQQDLGESCQIWYLGSIQTMLLQVHTSYFREGHEWDYLSVDIGWLEIDNWVYSLHYKLVWHLHVTEQHDNFLCQYCIHSLGCGCCTLLGELIPIAHHRRSLKRCDFMPWIYFCSVFCAFIPTHDHIIGTRLIVVCLIHLLLE